VEAHAPAPAKDAVVALHQRGERGPRRLIESLHGVRGLGHGTQPNASHGTSLFVPHQAEDRRPADRLGCTAAGHGRR